MKKIKKITIKYMLLAIALTLALSGTITAIDPQSVLAKAATSTVVSTELINYYSMTTSEAQRFMTTLQDQGITTLTLRINSYSEFTSNSNTAISKIKTIIPMANAYGISINVDLHTWYTTWDNKFRDSASDSTTNRNIYINYVKTTLAALNGYNVNAFMVLNEPQARTASNSENNFILNVIAAAHSVTSKPISVRFMGGYSPSTGHYSSAIDQATDFLCRNSYWDARQPTVSVYGCTETKLLTALNVAHNQNKELWITEFGKSNSNLAEQQSYVKAFVSFSKSKGIDAIFCWVSQPESSGETYNIFNGYTPNPAFYELVNTAVSNPTPSPTINPTPTLSPTPTSTPSTPQLTYPTGKWQRIWTTGSGQYLGQTNEWTLQFNNNWRTKTVAFGRSNDIMFTSSRTITLSAGTYTFTVGSDDGFRLYIDGKLVMQNWVDHLYDTQSCTTSLTSGAHQFRLDFYENTGNARVSFAYQTTTR